MAAAIHMHTPRHQPLPREPWGHTDGGKREGESGGRKEGRRKREKEKEGRKEERGGEEEREGEKERGRRKNQPGSPL